MKVSYFNAFITNIFKAAILAVILLITFSSHSYSYIGWPTEGTYVKNSITVTSYWGSISRDYNFWIYLYKKNVSTGVQTLVASQNCVHTTPAGSIGIPEGPGSVAWNVAVTFGADGNWQLIQTESRYGGSSTVNVIVDSTFPVVTVNAPNGGEQYYCGQVENLTWTATDNIGFPTNPVSIYFSADNGTSWLLITREANTGSYKFVSPPVPTTAAKVRMVFSDLAGNLVTKESAAVFTLRPFLTDMYVSPAPAGSDDTGNGTSSAPFRTLQRGLTNVAAGGTVHATGGTYNEKYIIWPSRNNITLKNEGSDVVIDPANLGDGISVFSQGLQLTIEGVTIQNSRSLFSGRPVYLPDHPPQGSAIFLVGNNTLDLKNCTFKNCVVEGTAEASGGGVIYSMGYTTINAKNCRFISNEAFAGGAIYGSNLKLENCIFDGNTSVKGGALYVTGTGAQVHAVNCTFNNNTATSSGDAIYNNGYGFYGTNCIIWGSNVPFYGSAYYLNNCNVQITNWSIVTTATNCLSINPQFKNSDLELKDTSPCLDTASIEAAMPSKDILGVTRVVNNNERPDIGAYEFPYDGTSKVHNITKSTNYPTIYSALRDAGANNTITIDNGRYGEYLDFWPNYNDITLIASNTSTWDAVEVNGSDVQPVMNFSNTSPAVRGKIEGLTISNGRSVNGAGINLPAGSNIVVERCYIKNNNATNNGGGLCNGKAINCVFESNSAYVNGGGTYNTTAETCIFTNNRVDTGNGGGMFGMPASDSIFTGNAAYNGGGKYVGRATRCVFNNNVGYNYGGGISNGQAYDSQFKENSANYGGGASDTKLDRCTFSNNSGNAAVYVSIQTKTIMNCLLYSNSGYGVYVDVPVGQTYKILNCTIDQAFPVYTNNDKTQIKNSIIRGGDIAKGVTGFYDSLSYSNFDTLPTVGTANNADSPEFVDTIAGNYRLMETSPCIDKGLTDTDCTTMDVAGNARINGTEIDMGAYEYKESTVALIAPIGGETMQYGGTYEISWEVYDSAGAPANAIYARLKYSLDGGVTWTRIASGDNLSPAKSYTWTVPSIDTDKGIVAVEIERVSGTIISTSESGIFSIHEKLVKLTEPRSGATLEAGTTYNIKWTVQDGQGNDLTSDLTYLRYSVDGGDTWVPINGGASVALATSFDWVVPLTLTNKCIISVDIARAGGAVINTSEATGISIVDTTPPRVSISADRHYLNASGCTISWIATDEVFGSTTPVILYLSSDNGVTWNPEQTPLNKQASGSYNYIPGVTGYMPLGQYRIKAVATDSSGHSSEAVAQFIIDTEAPTMEVTATTEPNTTDLIFTVKPYDKGKINVISVIPGETAVEKQYFTESAVSDVLPIKPARFGTHAVTFEVWDICGNMTRETVMVEVIMPDMPIISEVESDGNPLTAAIPNIGEKPSFRAKVQDYHENLDAENTYFILKNGNLVTKVLATVVQDPADKTMYMISANPTLPGYGTYQIFIEARDTNGNIATWESSSIRSLKIMSVSLKKPKTIPNPFNPRKDKEVAFVYKLSTDMNIILSVYDITQRAVWTQTFNAGENGGKAEPAENRVMWNGKNSAGVPVGNGVYVFIIRSGGKVISQGQMLVVN